METKPKKTVNPFLKMAQEAKAAKSFPNQAAPNKSPAPKPQKGFGAPMRKSSGRGR